MPKSFLPDLPRVGTKSPYIAASAPHSSIYRGVHLKYLPTIRHKYFDTVAHTFLSTLHLATTRQDAVLYCNAANAIFTWMPRCLGMPVALNVDGLERHRKKWNRLAQHLVSYFRAAGHVDAECGRHRCGQYRRILPEAVPSGLGNDSLWR